MSNTKNFFEAKKPWSHYKDSLFVEYLPIYFQKILKTNVDTLYIDGFAGKGKFDDGEKGSPLIVRDIIKGALAKTKSNSSILPYFVEYKYAKHLKHNLDDEFCNVVNGDYKEEVPKLLNQYQFKNVFLYVDPYGIKHMQYSIFDLLRTNKYNSKELLFNFNTFGFVREGCKLLKVEADDLECEVEQENETDRFINDVANMNRIAGGDYWQSIILENFDQTKGKVDGKRAEKIFIKKYVKQLGKIFKYVINIPIKTGDDLIPKYQMIYATDYIDGILLMSNIMLECNRKMKESFNYGQISMFDYIYETTINDDVLSVLTDEFVNIKQFCLSLYIKKGVKYTHKEINATLKELEKKGIVCIERTPSTTPTGKKATAVNIMDKTYAIRVRKNENI